MSVCVHRFLFEIKFWTILTKATNACINRQLVAVSCVRGGDNKRASASKVMATGHVTLRCAEPLQFDDRAAIVSPIAA